MFYGCATCQGSSGSPVLKIVDGGFRVVAVHRGHLKGFLNFGTRFSTILSRSSLIDEEGTRKIS